MIDDRTFVIVGAGLAGAKAAETLRAEGFSGRVVLLGEETERPYERPPLSKGLLLGTAERDNVYVHAADWYRRHDVELRTATPVRAIERAGHRVRLADDSTVGYDRLLLATGAEPRRLPLPGDVAYLRTLADSQHLAGGLRDGARLVIVGAGWIGLEIAAAARERGAAVTVVETAPLPLHRVLGDRLAASFAAMHAAHGVVFHFGRQAAEFRADGVVLDDGTLCPADTVLVAVGVRPRTELARAAGLAVDDGILVDHGLRTDDPDVFAAGDVAAVDHALFGHRIRVEHWATAIDTGAAAARSMLGQEVAYDRVPYFFTDQYDLGMEYAGWIPPGAEPDLVIRGDLDGREYVAFWHDKGQVLAGMNVNVWDVNESIQELVRARVPVDPARLADPSVPLADLANA
ncbi:FAD-dependent oxidoreductase [Actinoplanes sp. KI2]|uniref:NAD(P)/FAD-dependent oxidoreductase n=1 Tax=Actinoplanes sp. KI2 TaxID=2983315 RepID=UPI0021D6118B|nr:FAD-dependent oxidoreductase [Actinoplanes sp. KI2]MCU7729096.1 FAD-dependent oxidoreductase [Actinoplanes sp. KI2]